MDPSGDASLEVCNKLAMKQGKVKNKFSMTARRI